jgi:HEPN domain-containing protein
MKVFFSKRHEEALAFGKIKPSFSVPCRTSVEHVLSGYSEWGGNMGLENLTFQYVENKLKTFYGVDELKAFDEDNKRVPASLSQVIIKGYPSEVLDIIEAWFDENPTRARECEEELNDIFYIHSSPWRVVSGNVMLVDSEYLHGEVRAKTIQLLEESEVKGALEEYQDAVSDLMSGETKDAVTKAHKSVESVMKAVLEVNEGRFGQLLSALIKSDVIPDYYEGFLKNFEQLALGIVKERNLPARGHGQGKRSIKVSRSLAEFAVNLAGSINVFIIKHWMETKATLAEKRS